jgi:hypothetical protein
MQKFRGRGVVERRYLTAINCMTWHKTLHQRFHYIE